MFLIPVEYTCLISFFYPLPGFHSESLEVCAAVFALPDMYDYDFRRPLFQVGNLHALAALTECSPIFPLPSRTILRILAECLKRTLGVQLRCRSMVEWNPASGLSGTEVYFPSKVEQMTVHDTQIERLSHKFAFL